MTISRTVCMVVLTDVIHDSRVIREATALIENGYQVKIIGLPAEGAASRPAKYHHKPLRLRIRSSKTIGIRWFVRYLEFVLRAVAEGLRTKASYYHAHDLTGLIPCYIVAKLTGARVIYDSHELFFERDAQRHLLKSLGRPFERYLLRRVDEVIAANASRAEIMAKEYGAPRTPVVVMNISPYPTMLRRERYLRAYLEKQLARPLTRTTTVLYQGAISFQKRKLDNLIRAVARLDDAVLVLMGDGDIDEVTRFIQGNNLEKKVFLHPLVPQQELISYVSSADIGIVIYGKESRNDYFCAPNKLFEYIAGHVLICGSNNPEVEAMISNYGLGEVFDPDCVNSIEQALRTVQGRLGEDHSQAFEKVQRDMNWQRESLKLLDIYKRLS